jgi:penicillin-insensitive murein endopeptidase
MQGSGVRAERLFLFFALSLLGIVLIRAEALLPAAFDFIQPSHADPVLNQQSGAQADPPKTKSAAVDHELPAFVPDHQTLTFASDSEAGSDAKSKAATATPDAQSKASEWPEFIGAKKLFGAVKEPAPLAARAIGTYARGCLSGAVALPIDGPAWQEMRLSRNRNWGHPKLIALIEQFAKDAQKLDGWPGLLVGDIAQPRGGPMITGHASHQVGLDADFWLTPMPDRRLTAEEREDLQAATMLDGTGLAVDPKVFTDKQVALIKRAASYPEVERIFVHPAIKKALCQVAGTDRKWLGKVRPFYGHYYHFHMRIKCPPGFAGCKPQTPPTGADGCGKEVNQWLARVVPAKTPAPPPPPVSTSSKPPKPPIMLSELPKECQALLRAKPDPVPIPREALMTATAVRQVLAKAAAVKLALAKAAATPGATKTAAAGAASSPALRPHLRKTVAAAKK